MKHKKLIIGSLVAVTVACLLVLNPWGNKPFKDLSANEIAAVSIELMPPNKTFELTPNQINDLASVLQTAVLYNKAPLEPLAGQSVIYQIEKTDGTTIKVEPMGDLIQIDGVRYKTKYEPSEELNRLANDIANSK